MNASLLKNKKRMIFIAAVLVLLLGVGGVSAYFTSTDNATNSWTVGDVTIELLEEEYDKVPEAERQNITPNQSFTKDPVVKNVGTNDAFVFLRFSVPKANVKIASQDGSAQTSQMQELFDYTIQDGWVKVSEDTSAADKNTYVYSYGTEAACKALAAEASTPSLFKDNQITFINVLEGQGLEGTTLEIPVESFGIQTTDLGESDATSPSAVWDILIHQVDTK
mgnify:CR=1 FL=1